MGATSSCTLSAAGTPPAARTPTAPKVRSSIQGLRCLAKGWTVLQPQCFRAMAATPIPSFIHSSIGHPCLTQFALLASSVRVTVQVTLASAVAPGKAAALTWERAKLGLKELLTYLWHTSHWLHHCQRSIATAYPYRAGPGR